MVLMLAACDGGSADGESGLTLSFVYVHLGSAGVTSMVVGTGGGSNYGGGEEVL